MRSSFQKQDVTLLLKDITGLVTPLAAEEREALIQAGKHYCEMLPIEDAPSEKYMQAYEKALQVFSDSTAHAVGCLSEKIMDAYRSKVVLVSLARAGTPVGILLKRYFLFRYGLDIPHYSISIIRGKGLDQNAMRYLLAHHSADELLFVDGWVGKGAIFEELKKSVTIFPGVSSALAVLADPANITPLCGTNQDILIPSACLNATVSGLISRTFLREDVVGPGDFHGAVCYENLSDKDLTYSFIDTICAHFKKDNPSDDFIPASNGIQDINHIADFFAVDNLQMIKPGIGETTRVLLRRVPWKILISDSCSKDSALSHILQLAEERHVPVVRFPMKNYKACGIIRRMADT